MDRRNFCQQLVGSSFILSSLADFSLAETPKIGGPGSSKINWQNSLKAAHKISVEQDKPLMIVFGASWCTFCHKLERETLGDRQIAAIIEREFIPVHLDFDKNRNVAKILEVESLPCVVILSPEADLLVRTVGFAEVKEFRSTMSSALEKRLAAQKTRAATASR